MAKKKMGAKPKKASKPGASTKKKQVDVELAVEGQNRISITFPKGTVAALRKRVPLADLLAVLRGPEPEVEGQWEGSDTVVCCPGSG